MPRSEQSFVAEQPQRTPVAGTPERGGVVQRAKELVDFARSQGYRLVELVKIIEDVG